MPAKKKSPVKKPSTAVTKKVSTAPKTFPIRNYLTALGGLIVIVLLLFVFRGWFRVTVIPKSFSMFYNNGIQTTLDNEMSNLQNPFVKLGYTSVNKIGTGCSLQQAQSIHTEIDCSAERHGYTKTPKSSTGEANLETQAQNIQNALQKNGWQDGGNGVTLTSLVDGTYHGIDYSPDAYYEKVVGNYDCVFDTTVAYANPNPAAISSTFSCDRTVDILGAPGAELYTSSKGHY